MPSFQQTVFVEQPIRKKPYERMKEMKESPTFLEKILFIYFLRGVEGEREGERHQYVVAFCMSLAEDLACNPSMCSNWELNWQPFGSQAGAQFIEPHQLGQNLQFLFASIFSGKGH